MWATAHRPAISIGPDCLMPRSNLIARHLKSLDDVKAAAVQLRHALEDVGLTVAPGKVLEVMARLCDAPSYEQLQRSLKGITPLDRSAPSADVRLPTLPEVLTQLNAEGAGPLVGQIQFWQKDSAPHWCYAISLTAIEASALEAARRLVLGLPMRATDAKWVTGRFSKVSVINDEKAASPLTVDTTSLAGAAYLGDGHWSVGDRYYCRVSVDDKLLIERRGVPVPLKAMANEAIAAVRFVPPPEFAAAGFEVFTVNIETELMFRCLKLRDAGCVLESLRLVGQRLAGDRSKPARTPHGLRAALFRADKGGRVQVVTIYGQKGNVLAGLRWEGTRWDGIGSPTVGRRPEEHDLPGSRLEDSGKNGLGRIWLEIRAWISWCDCSSMALTAVHADGRQPQRAEAPARSFPQFLEEVAEAEVPLSQIRRADMEKWVAGARDWEQTPDGAEAKLPGSWP
jgi:hypothetical protein